ncbi:MAG: hypothetical protein GF317_12425 [Candidatus Lokiarchaeota archaeon]|nr:hypothetical protein [Candidatus Lokiarchaeota archaeon]MBD3200452.1 hypothetical protein [Candidatus Lokiarchaeota archaeon]
MFEDIELFIGIAHIAGIFVGFGALISLTGRDEIEASQLGRIRSVVTSGLLVIVASLVPIGLDRYGITGHIFWFICSLIYFIINWMVIIFSLRNPENKEAAVNQIKSKTVIALLFWLLLEIPFQIPLILTFTGLFPDLEPAFYTTALLFGLFEAVFVLGQVVYSQSNLSSTNKRPMHI